MSGGHFEYKQYSIRDIYEEIEYIIENNKNENEKEGYYHDYPEDIINIMKKAIIILRKAYIYARRIDWLVSGDDGDNDFKERLKEELKELNEKIKKIKND